MAGELQIGFERPLHLVTQKFRQEEHIKIASVRRVLQQRPDALEDLFIVVRRHPVLDEATPDRGSDVALDLSHERLDAKHRYFEKASSTLPGSPRHNE